jgi:hypothetical protein
VDGKASIWCRVVATTMWPKTTYKNLILQACRIFLLGLALFVLGGGSMCCSNIGAKFRSQYLSHMMLNLGGVFPL